MRLLKKSRIFDFVFKTLGSLSEKYAILSEFKLLVLVFFSSLSCRDTPATSRVSVLFLWALRTFVTFFFDFAVYTFFNVDGKETFLDVSIPLHRV